MLIDAINAAFQDREIAFDAIGVNIATNVLLSGVHDGMVRGEIPSNPGVDMGLVGHETAIAMCAPSNQRTEHLRGDVRNMETADAAMESIAAASGIAARTFFYYFKTKDEILQFWQGGGFI